MVGLGFTDKWPEIAPEGLPKWTFWPRWNTKESVDVVCEWPDGHVILFEAKHWGSQHSTQWREQILALNGRKKPPTAVTLVAVGGIAAHEDEKRLNILRQKLKAINPAMDPQVYRMAWEDLCLVCEAQLIRERQKAAGTGAILHDMVLGLRAFGRPSRLLFGTLQDLGPGTFDQSLTTMGNLPSISGHRSRASPTQAREQIGPGTGKS